MEKSQGGNRIRACTSSAALQIEVLLPQHPVLLLDTGNLHSDIPLSDNLGFIGTPNGRVPFFLEVADGLQLGNYLPKESGFCLEALPQTLAKTDDVRLVGKKKTMNLRRKRQRAYLD